jgi:hypothetical protein
MFSGNSAAIRRDQFFAQDQGMDGRSNTHWVMPDGANGLLDGMRAPIIPLYGLSFFAIPAPK